MRAIMVMFDSLNRHMLPPYNADTWVKAPNFQRLAERSVTFDTSYVCSMPCMPARRDFHTGRPSFLHRSWSPLEPFDDSVPQLLKQAKVHTHLASDHYHYWEDGGSTYHSRYTTWQAFRGQEGDPFVGQVEWPEVPETLNTKGRITDWINRQHQARDEDQPQSMTFRDGLEFIERNHEADQWFLQIETFDPHQPFTTHRQWQDRYPTDYDGPIFDWPGFPKEDVVGLGVQETPEQVAECTRQYAALVSKCDASLGDVLDMMDRHDMWDDTMLIVWTDHGFLFGEHGGWDKNWQPLYEEVAHTPFFMWDPRAGVQGERRKALVQPAIDLGPTLLSYFGVDRTPDMLGKDLAGVVADDTPVREAAIFGFHGRHVNVTDGRYVYMRERVASNSPLYEYGLMPWTMRQPVSVKDLQQAELAGPFTFSKGVPLLRWPSNAPRLATLGHGVGEHLLWDVQQDPKQENRLHDDAIESRMIDHMTRLMAECDAPPEQYERLDLDDVAR